jgi:hypothetical protein
MSVALREDQNTCSGRTVLSSRQIGGSVEYAKGQSSGLALSRITDASALDAIVINDPCVNYTATHQGG